MGGGYVFGYASFPSHKASYYLRIYVLSRPIYDTYVYAILRIYPVLRTATYDVPCMVKKMFINGGGIRDDVLLVI